MNLGFQYRFESVEEFLRWILALPPDDEKGLYSPRELLIARAVRAVIGVLVFWHLEGILLVLGTALLIVLKLAFLLLLSLMMAVVGMFFG